MIALQRVRTSAAVHVGFHGQKRVASELKLLKAVRDGGFDKLIKSAPWKKTKAQLRDESRMKCAYCDGLADNQHGDVEHFRPKNISDWWWLALCYDNYLFSCQLCNQSYKIDKFPLAQGGAARGSPPSIVGATDAELIALAGSLAPDPINIAAGRTLANYEADCVAELALLVNPYSEDPEQIFIYEADPTPPAMVKIRPRTSALAPRVAACEDCFGINREDLCRLRWSRYRVLEKTWQAWQNANAAGKADIEGIFTTLLAPEMPYLGMARYFVREVWRVPGF